MPADSTIPNLPVQGSAPLATDALLMSSDPDGVPVDKRVSVLLVATAVATICGGGTLTGTGAPEGVTTGAVGQWYSDITDTAHPAFYFKTTGAGNTGWIFILQIA